MQASKSHAKERWLATRTRKWIACALSGFMEGDILMLEGRSEHGPTDRQDKARASLASQPMSQE